MTAPFLLLPHRTMTVNASGGDAVSGPSVNLTNEEIDMVWRSAALTNTYVIFDLASALTVDTVAVLFNNLRASDTVQIRSGTTAANCVSAPLSNQTFTAWSGTKNPDARAKTVCQLTAPVTARYWRMDIVATGHPDGFVQVARVAFGSQVAPQTNFDLNATRIVDEQSVVYSGPGFTDVDEYPTLPGWKMSFSQIDGTLWRDTVFPFLTRAGVNKRCVLFVPQPDVGASQQNEVVYGRITEKFSGEQRIFDGWWLDLAITSIGL